MWTGYNRLTSAMIDHEVGINNRRNAIHRTSPTGENYGCPLFFRIGI